MISDLDRRFVDAAIRLGNSALGRTWPNPAVGAILVRFDSEASGIVVGRGVTGDGGRPHAEEIAIDRAGERARGATMYVSLEPCAHRNRPRVSPCAHRLTAAGVGRVVAAIQDPNPTIHGRGFDHLREHGMTVVDSVAPVAGDVAHAGHFSRMSRGRPHVTLKLAVSADGMIGRSGEGQVAITGREARRRVHMMRAQSDAIMVGVGTILSDDPRLDCRLPGLSDASPVRVVLDTQARTPPGSALARTAFQIPTWVLTAPIVDRARVQVLAGSRIEVLPAPITVGAREDRINMGKALGLLADRGITRLMVEGGSRVAADLLHNGYVDEVASFRSGRVIGEGGIPALATGSLDDLLERGFGVAEERPVGEDWLTVWRGSS